MTTSDDCLFCKIVRGDIKSTITYRDDRTVAFKDLGPKAPLHELVVPTRHIASLADATPADVELFGHLMVVAAQRVKESGLAGNGSGLENRAASSFWPKNHDTRAACAAS